VVTLENGYYVHDESTAIFLALFSAPLRFSFPRSFLCVDGREICGEEVRSYRNESPSYWREFSFSGLPVFQTLEQICIPASVKRLGQNCFEGYRSLRRVAIEFGSQLSVIGDSAFRACSSLSSIHIRSSVETLSEHCFCECGSLSTVTFEPGARLARIEVEAFWHCSSLWLICIPSSVETISASCFTGCQCLWAVTFESDSQLSTLESSAFSPC
jgi:hypothetical protein